MGTFAIKSSLEYGNYEDRHCPEPESKSSPKFGYPHFFLKKTGVVKANLPPKHLVVPRNAFWLFSQSIYGGTPDGEKRGDLGDVLK